MKEFNLQLFAEELTIDQAVDKINGTETKEEPAETTTEKPASEPEKPEAEQPETTPEEQPDKPEEEPAVAPDPVDYNLKVKFKANGQDHEKSIQELINDSQLAANYNKRMQEMSDKEKAFNASLAQQQQQTQQVDPSKAFEDLNNAVTARAMRMLGINDPEEFVPDSSGIIGSKIHYAAYQKAMMDVQQEKQQVDYQVAQERAIEDNYVSTVNNFAKETDFLEINKFAQLALFKLPASGEEGVKKFQAIYGTYQKVMQRDQYWNEMQAYGRSNTRPVPFRDGEVKALTDFYNECKEEFSGSKVKAQVKAQVPKSVPIKPTVKTETTGNGETAPSRKVDFKKIQTMDLDDIAKML